MGWLSKLGKIALVAAPYVAAPFTGGASLMATGATNAALQKWNEKDAKNRAAKGLAPSKFDKYLGYTSTGAGLASGLGAFGALGSAGKAASAISGASKAASTASTASKFANTLSNVNKGMAVAGAVAPMIAAARGGGSSNETVNPNAQSSTGIGPSTSYGVSREGVMPRGGFSYRDNPMNQEDQSSPNLARSIFQGRQEAIKNQPFRSGYSVNAISRDDVPYTYEQGPITPNSDKNRRRKKEAVAQ
jgi:hypothetical protein